VSETDTDPSALARLKDDPSSRRRFLRIAGGTGAAGALGLLIAACGGDDMSDRAATTTIGAATGSTATSAAKRSDLAIVNYALTLEYLEADFYDQAIESGELKDRKVAELAKRIGDNEHAHVEALMATAKSLGTPAAKPMTKFDDVIAGGQKKILETAAVVENLGAAAYLGQAGRIKSKEILAAALAIHTVEARHAAALNQLVGKGFKGGSQLAGSIPDGAFAKAMDMDQVLAQVKPFIAS